MPRLTKRIVESAELRPSDYFIWDDDLAGFGVRILASGKRSYLVQYRSAGRTRRYTIGRHGVWTPETARREGRVLLGRIAQGQNPAEDKKLDIQAITIKQLCERYLEDADKGLVLGKGNRPKRASTLIIDRGRIKRHILPLLGTRRAKDLTSADVTRFLRDVMAGRTKSDVKTRARGRAIVRGGPGTAARAVGLLGGIYTYAKEQGIVESNPVHGVRRPADKVKTRRLSETEFRLLGEILRAKAGDEQFRQAATMVRFLALTGCRRGEVLGLLWSECDFENSCLRLIDSKEGASVRPIGLPVIDVLDPLRTPRAHGLVFPGTAEGTQLLGFPKLWIKMLKGTALSDITPHVLRHSFASVANDLGFTEMTVATLLGHSRGTVTSRYIHTVDTALIIAADTIAGYINALLNDMPFKRKSFALDRASREEALAQFLDRLGEGTEARFG